MRFGWSKKNVAKPGTVPRRRITDTAPDDVTMSAAGPFRRNQTITGTSSSIVSSAASHDTQLRSARQEAHELRRFRRSLLSLIVVTLIACGVLFIVLYESVLSADVSLYGQIGALSQSQESSFRKVIDQYYGANPLQRIRWFFSPDQLASYLRQHGHPEIGAVVSVQPKALGSAVMTLKAREPIASWTINGTQHFVDSDGIVFNDNYYSTPQISIVDNSGSSPQQGAIASGRLLQFIGLATGKLKSYGYTIRQVVLPTDTTREVEFILSTDVGIKMTIDRSAGEQCEDAARAVQYFTAHQLNVEYVDVRVSREAFYKER